MLHIKTMTRITALLLMLCMIQTTCFTITASAAYAAGASVPNGSDISGDDSAEPGELIVVYEDSEALDADGAAEKAEETVSVEIDECQTEPVADSVGSDGAAALIKLENEEDAENARELLEEQDGVAYVQPNFRYGMMESVTVNDPYRDELYHLNKWDDTFKSQCGANVEGAWELMGGVKASDDTTDDPVTIAVLDSGCQVTHEDLRDAIDIEHVYDAVKKADGPESIEDQSGHGTHVAGIAAGVTDNGKGISGAAGNYASLLPINVFEGKWSRTSDMITAFSYLERLMDSGELQGLHVINMSLGGYGEMDEDDLALSDYIIRMREKDVLTVCAGGNGDEQFGIAYKDNPCFPGDFDACLCVTSLDSDGTNSIFSDYNEYKDISAPGSFVFSTMTDGTGTTGDSNDGKYGFLSGTSMASPLVAGIAGLLWADNPQLTADQVFESIISTAHDVNPKVNSHVGETGSAGAIDAAAAMVYAREHFDTERVRLSENDVTLDTAEFVYDGEHKRPGVTVIHDGVVLTENEDYLVSYQNDIEAGTAAVTVTGISEYIGSVIFEYDIKAADIKDAQVTCVPDEFDFDGAYHFPATLKVVLNNRELKWGRDFSVNALTNGVSEGTHKIELIGKGNYTGTHLVEYLIKGEETKPDPPDIDPPVDPDPEEQKKKETQARIAAAKRYKVAGFKVTCRSRKFTAAWKKTKGATGYQVQYRLKGRKWAQLKKTTKLKALSKRLKKGKKYQFRVRTYTKIAGGTYYGKWTTVKTVKCR